MKQKLILLFLLITTISFAQPGQNPNDGNPIANPTSFNRLKIPLAPKKLSATRVIVQDSITKELGWVLKSSISSSVPTLQQVSNAGSQISSGSYSTQLTAGDLSLSSIFDGSDLDPFSLTFYKSGNSVSIKPPTTVTGTYGVFLPSSSGTLALLSDIPSGGSGTVTSVTGISPITIATGTTTPVIGINQATTSTNGYLSSTDWNTFNNKQNALGFTPEASISSGTTSQYWRGDKTWQTLPAYTLSGLGGVASNTAITGATKAKITYDSKGLVTAGTDLIASDIPNIAESQVTNLTTDLSAKAPIASPTFTGTVSGVTATMVGLGNVNNTSDASKPISTATQTALDLKQDDLFTSQTSKGYQYYHDFVGVAVNNASDGEVAYLPSGTGATLVYSGQTVPAIASNQIGFLPIQTGSTATGWAGVFLGSNNYGFVSVGGGAISIETSVIMNDLSNSTDRFWGAFGLQSASGSGVAIVNGIEFVYDEGGVITGNSASPNWKTVTSNGSTRTFTDTGVAVSSTAWQKLRIDINAAGTEVKFYINGTLVSPTHTTNIPTGTSKLMAASIRNIKTIGTTSRILWTDYFAFKQTFTTPR